MAKIIANITNNGIGAQNVLSDKNDKLSGVQVPPKSRGNITFVDEASFNSAVEQANKMQPKVLFITKQGA